MWIAMWSESNVINGNDTKRYLKLVRGNLRTLDVALQKVL
jgi:hypothetical protein